MKKLQQITETNNTGSLFEVYLTLFNLAREAKWAIAMSTTPEAQAAAETVYKAARAKADLAWVAFRDATVTP